MSRRKYNTTLWFCRHTQRTNVTSEVTSQTLVQRLRTDMSSRSRPSNIFSRKVKILVSVNPDFTDNFLKHIVLGPSGKYKKTDGDWTVTPTCFGLPSPGRVRRIRVGPFPRQSRLVLDEICGRDGRSLCVRLVPVYVE